MAKHCSEACNYLKNQHCSETSYILLIQLIFKKNWCHLFSIFWTEIKICLTIIIWKRRFYLQGREIIYSIVIYCKKQKYSYSKTTHTYLGAGPAQIVVDTYRTALLFWKNRKNLLTLKPPCLLHTDSKHILQ